MTNPQTKTVVLTFRCTEAEAAAIKAAAEFYGVTTAEIIRGAAVGASRRLAIITVNGVRVPA